jgi:hypothetical protein
MAQKSLEERDADVSRLDGELIALSIANADQERSLEEEEARLLLLEVRNCLSRSCVPDRREFDCLFPCPQGGANHASPRTGQGAEGGRVHPHPVAFVKGAAGRSERGGNGERELTRRG